MDLNLTGWFPDLSAAQTYLPVISLTSQQHDPAFCIIEYLTSTSHIMVGPSVHFQIREENYSWEKEDIGKIIWNCRLTTAWCGLLKREDLVHWRKNGILAFSILNSWNKHSQRSERQKRGKKTHLSEKNPSYWFILLAMHKN